MNRRVYPQRRTFLKYNDKQVLAYLNEEEVENYIPEDAPEDTEPVTGYAYTGTEEDGGTLLDSDGADRDSLINAVIRTRYSQTEEDAIKTHQILLLQNPDHEKKSEYQSEWAQFLIERQYAIDTVDAWL